MKISAYWQTRPGLMAAVGAEKLPLVDAHVGGPEVLGDEEPVELADTLGEGGSNKILFAWCTEKP
jgi:hypothetical protein